MDKDLQIINDEITSHKRSLSEVEDKLEVLSFLHGIDSSLESSLTSDAKELLAKKKLLEEGLKVLREKKSKLSKKSGKEESTLEVSPQNSNPVRLGNYLSSVNSAPADEKEESRKNI